MEFSVLFGIGILLPSGPDYTIMGLFVAFACIFATMAGFAALITGMILLLVRRTVTAGRLTSLIGMGFYHLAALGLILATSIGISANMDNSGGSQWDIVVFIPLAILAGAVTIFLPAFFIDRTLIRAQKAENVET